MTRRSFGRSGGRQLEEQMDNWGHGCVKATWQVEVPFFFPFLKNCFFPQLSYTYNGFELCGKLIRRYGKCCTVQVQQSMGTEVVRQADKLFCGGYPLISRREGERIDAAWRNRSFIEGEMTVWSPISIVSLSSAYLAVTSKTTTVRLNRRQRLLKGPTATSVVQCVNRGGFGPLWLMVAVEMFAGVSGERGNREPTHPGSWFYFFFNVCLACTATKHISRQSRQSGPDVFGREPEAWMGPDSAGSNPAL